jgi:hypothetical protein
MKKLYITLLSVTAFAFAANAQLTLTGSTYYQNFNGIGGGLPTGWSVDTNATATHLGNSSVTWYPTATGTYYDTTDCASDIFSHGFKNSASADSNGTANATLTCAQQVAITNRALSVRQSGSWGDPGASFQLELANTTGFQSFNLAFRLQALDILSGKTTTWTVDYGIGATPTTFTPIATVPTTLAVGGYHFNDTNVIATFGSAIDNQSQPVWIRISALSKSSGSGNRSTIGIDDFVLTYTPEGIENLQSQSITFKTLGIATSNNVNFACNVNELGQYSLGIYDITGRKVYTKQVNLTPGAQNTIQVADANLVSGMYIARIENGSVSGIAKVIVQ